jgi:hypothetical protein
MLVGVLLVGWLVVAWGIVKRPLLSVPIAVYVGLAVWLGAHDAQALVVYAVIGLVAWRLGHKTSYQRVVGRRLRQSWRRLWSTSGGGVRR